MKVALAVLGLALLASLGGNVALRWKQQELIDAAVHSEIVARHGIEDLAYLLRGCGLRRDRLIDLSRQQPLPPGSERLPGEMTGMRFSRFPLEISFTETGEISSIMVAGERY